MPFLENEFKFQRVASGPPQTSMVPTIALDGGNGPLMPVTEQPTRPSFIQAYIASLPSALAGAMAGANQPYSGFASGLGGGAAQIKKDEDRNALIDFQQQQQDFENKISLERLGVSKEHLRLERDRLKAPKAGIEEEFASRTKIADILGLVREERKRYLATGQLAPPKESAKSDFEEAYFRDHGRYPTVKELVDYKKEVAAAGRNVNQQTISNESNLRDEYNKRLNDIKFAEVDRSIERIRASAASPSPAGDLALIFNYMKMLDPGSTVREGEFANAQNSGSIPERIRAQYNKAIQGTRLTDEQRKDFVDRAESLYQSVASRKGEIDTFYTGLAKGSGIDPSRVIENRKGGGIGIKRDKNGRIIGIE